MSDLYALGYDDGFRVGVEKAPSYKENEELRNKIEQLEERIEALELWYKEGEKLFNNYAVGLGAMFGIGKWWGERPWNIKYE